MKSRSIHILLVLAAIGAAVAAAQRGNIALAAPPAEKTIHITAKKFEFAPADFTVKNGEPIALEIKSEDVKHGFSLPDFKIRADIKPGQATTVRFTPDKTGQFTFHCDVFCGGGHEDMSGTITVSD